MRSVGGPFRGQDVCIVLKRPAKDRDIPLSIVSYVVERTLEAVILEDGENSRVYGKGHPYQREPLQIGPVHAHPQ